MALRSLILAIFIAIPSAARAAAPIVGDITPDAVYGRIDVTNVAAQGNSFLKLSLDLGTTFTIVKDRLNGNLELQLGPGFASFDQKLGSDLSASTNWRCDNFVALLGGGRLTVFRRSWMDVGLRFAYEASLYGTPMSAQKFSFKDKSGTYDVTDYAKDHASMSAGWTRLAADLDVRVPILDVWTAYASFGLTRYTFALNINVDKKGEEMIKSIGQDPGAVERTYNLDYLIPTFKLGSDVFLPKLPIYLNLEVSLVPVSIEQLFLGGTIGIGLKL